MARTAILIGGAGGIGHPLALRLAAQGWRLHLIGRTAAKLEALAAEMGGTWAQADVRDTSALAAAVAAAPGPVGALAYAAGTITLKPLARITPDDARADFEVNALGAMAAVQAALPALKAEGGSVVLFSSVAVGQGFANHASIAMAKGAVEGLTRALAAELAPKIRVNCIAPSLTETPLAAVLTANAQMASAIAGLHPLQRLGAPDDIAAAAAFLLSDEAGWISGQILGVDGGRSSLRTKG
ncbi:SDR family NAD(P)-dependent oxidoreductase [Azorhizobium caulinodans]|uniref:SDR family NAD(P)-dependent oxidoreductase n=1 Tax=Azorhizobium caulinodans TaxID=7 RepID=UPI002FBF185A